MKKILIVTEQELKNKINIKKHKVEILNTKVDEELIKKLNDCWYDKYKYVVFVNGCIMYKNITHYIPINCEDKSKNMILINEIFLNPIIINNIRDIIDDENSVIKLAVILKHLVKVNITIDEFNLEDEIENIRKINNFDKESNERIIRDIHKIIKQHYTQKSFIRKINFEIRKQKIVKIFLFKVLKNIVADIKKNTKGELVFKELVSIII